MTRWLSARHRMGAFWGRLRADRRGATAIEYGLIIAMIVLTMMVAFVEVADKTTGMWRRVGNSVENAR